MSQFLQQIKLQEKKSGVWGEGTAAPQFHQHPKLLLSFCSSIILTVRLPPLWSRASCYISRYCIRVYSTSRKEEGKHPILGKLCLFWSSFQGLLILTRVVLGFLSPATRESMEMNVFFNLAHVSWKTLVFDYLRRRGEWILSSRLPWSLAGINFYCPSATASADEIETWLESRSQLTAWNRGTFLTLKEIWDCFRISTLFEPKELTSYSLRVIMSTVTNCIPLFPKFWHLYLNAIKHKELPSTLQV